MAYFAELDTTNTVLRVVAIASDVLTDERGFDHEEWGVAFCKQLFGADTKWVRTSYGTHGGVHTSGGIPLRKNFAGVGYVYDTARDAFIPPTPEGDGWVFNETTCTYSNPAREAAAASVITGVTRV